MASLRPIPEHPALWRGESVSAAPPGVATGFPALDALLPGGGWPANALTEIFAARPGIGELSLLVPTLARLSGTDRRWIMLIAPPYLPYAPALAAAGVDLARLVVVRPRSAAEALWAARQALASGSCSALLAWLAASGAASLRRLQLAAEGAHTVAVLYRPAGAAAASSPAALKLFLEATGGKLAVHVLKRRGSLLTQPVLLEVRPAMSSAAHVPSAPAQDSREDAPPLLRHCR
jgi:cell division inhibitor SulA/protein ImuA